jgi:hypothetical protein
MYSFIYSLHPQDVTGIQVIHVWSQLPRKKPLVRLVVVIIQVENSFHAFFYRQVVQSYVKNPYLILWH